MAARWIGVEQEFELFGSNGRKLDFRTLFDRVASDLAAVRFRGLPTAALSPKGYVLSADLEEAEVSTAPVDVDIDGLDAVATEALRGRADLLDRLAAAPVAEVRGYSTHLSLSCPTDRVWDLAEVAIRTFLPAYMLLAEAPGSAGLLVRPRFERLELCGEYLDRGRDLTNLAIFAFGAVERLRAAPLPEDWPRFAPSAVDPSPQRQGYRVRLHAYGDDIAALGRHATLGTTSGGAVEAGALLARWAAEIAPLVEPHCTRAAFTRFLATCRGDAPLPIDRAQPAAVAALAEPAFAAEHAHNLAAALTALPPAFEIAFLDWTGLALRLPGPREVLSLPFPEIGAFVSAVRQGRWREHVAGLPRAAGALRRIEQLTRAARFASVDVPALRGSAEGGKKKRPGGGRPLKPGGGDVVIVDKPKCLVALTLSADKLCLDDTGGASVQTTPAQPDEIVWTLTSGLRLLGGQGTHAITFEPRRAGLHTVRCMIRTGEIWCEGEARLVTPELGLVTGDDMPVFCVGVAGHAPGVRLVLPTVGGTAPKAVAAARRSGATLDDVVVPFTVEGALVDPLGCEGVTLEVEAAPGLDAPAAVPVDAATGAFRFEAEATGIGFKRLVLRATGVSGGRAVAVVAGVLRVAADHRASAEAAKVQAGNAFAAERAANRDALFPGGDPTAAAPDLSQAALDQRRARLSEALQAADLAGKAVWDAQIDHLEFVWSAGETAMTDELSDKSRYKLIAIDAMPPLGPSADLLDDTFKLAPVVTTLVSVDPEAFVPVPGGHDDIFVPRTVATVLQGLPPAIQDDYVEMVYRDCRHPVGAPYRVTVEGPAFALVQRPGEDEADGPLVVTGDAATAGPAPKTALGRKPARLTARAHGKGAGDVARFVWRVVYGPDLDGCEIATEGALEEIGRFSAEVPGLYQVEVHAISDHENPLAAAVQEVEVVDVGLLLHSPDVQEAPHEDGVDLVASVDVGEHVRVEAELWPTSDGGQWPLRLRGFEATWRWSGTEVAATGGGTVADETTEAMRPYRIGRVAGETLRASVELVRLTLTDLAGARQTFELAGDGFGDELGEIHVVAGAPARVSLRILSPGVALADVTERVLAAQDLARQHQYERVEDIRESALALGEFRIGDTGHMRFVFEAKDQHDNPVQPEVEVGFQSFGEGEILTSGGSPADAEHLFEFDDRGRVTMGYRVPQTSLGKSLVMATIADRAYFVGNAMAAVGFRAAAAPSNPSVTVSGETIWVSELTGAAYVDLQALGPGGTATTARLRVHAQIAGGSIRERDTDSFTPDLQTITGPDGRLRLYLNPNPHTPDGDVPLGARKVWGPTNLILAVGVAKQVFTVHFDAAATIRRAPRLELPMMPLVRQDSLAWLPRPDDRNAAGLPPIAPGDLLGQAGREILLEVREHVAFRPYAAFGFDTPVTGLWNPPLASGAPPDPDYVAPVPIELRTRNASTAGAALAGHAIVAPPPVGSPSGGNAMRLHYSIPAALAGLDYSATVPGAAGFRVRFDLLASDDQEEWDVVTLVGSDPSHAPVEDRGALRISFTSLNVPPSLVVRYDPKGCPARPQPRMIPIPRHIPLGQWVPVEVTVMPEAGRDQIEVEARIGAGPAIVRHTDHFNYLAGTVYHLRLGRPDGGDAWIDRLEYLIPQNTALHLRRPEDGLRTLWHMETLAADTTTPPLVNQPRDGVTRPTFSQDLQRHAQVAVSYCDATEFERIQIGAADETVARAAGYTEDVLLSFIVGDAQTVPGMGADFVAGMVGWGDARDIVKNLAFAWPGGRDPDWHEFGLAVCGLAMDVAQVFTGPGAAAPNALIGCIKVMLKRLRPFIDTFPQAGRIAHALAGLARRILIDMRGARVARGANFVITVNDLRQLVPSGLVDFLFANLTEAHLKTFVEFARTMTPPFNPFAPMDLAGAYDHIRGLPENAGRVAEMVSVVELLMARIELVVWFFNPTFRNIDDVDDVAGGFHRIMSWLGDLDAADAREAARRTKHLLDQSLDWDVSKLLQEASPQSATRAKLARELMRDCLKVVGGLFEGHGDVFNDARVMRGFMAFLAASGPRATAMMVKGYRLPQSRAQFIKLMRLCDHAAECMADAAAIKNYAPALQRDMLNRLWRGLAARNGVKAGSLGARVNRNLRDGAEAQLLAIAAFSRGRRMAASGHMFDLAYIPLGPHRREIADLWGGFIEGGISALEVKSIRPPFEKARKHMNRIFKQYEDWVKGGYHVGNGVKQFNYALYAHGTDAAKKARALDAGLNRRFNKLLEAHNRNPLLHPRPPPPEVYLLDRFEEAFRKGL